MDESLGQWRQKNNDEKQKDHEDYSRLKQAKKEILKTLIPMQEQQLEKMKEDLKNTDDDQETIQLQTSENYMNKI